MDSLDSKESSEDMASSFQFVTITKPGHGWKNKNEHIVRSHVMRQVRQKQREQRTSKAGEVGDYHVNRYSQRYALPDCLACRCNSSYICLQQLAPIVQRHLTVLNRLGKQRKRRHPNAQKSP